MSRRLTDRGRERRQQIMDFASARFAERGFHPTSVAEIVEGIGVGKGVFYWYFESKEELFLEILREAQLELRRAQQQMIGDEHDAVRRIELGVRASLDYFDRHRELFNLFQFAATDETFAPVLREGQQTAVADTVRHLKEAMVDGRIAQQDPDLLAHAMLGVISQISRTYLHQQGRSASDVADETVTFCLRGMIGS